MKSKKTTPIVSSSDDRPTLCYVVSALTLVFVSWVLVRIIVALHVLVVSQALANTPDLSPEHSPIAEVPSIRGEAYSILQNPAKYSDGKTVYTADDKDWLQ